MTHMRLRDGEINTSMIIQVNLPASSEKLLRKFIFHDELNLLERTFLLFKRIIFMEANFQLLFNVNEILRESDNNHFQ